MKMFETFECSGKICQISYINSETTSWFLSKFCIPLQFHERLLLCSFLAQTIYTLLNGSLVKWKFLRLSSARFKFCQIPYAYFETASRFLFKFCIPLQFHERQLLYTFLADKINTLLKRSPLKWTFWRLRSKFVKFLMLISKRHVDSSPNFVSLCNFMKDNSSVLLSSSNIYFAQKEHIKMKTFETFKCSG